MIATYSREIIANLPNDNLLQMWRSPQEKAKIVNNFQPPRLFGLAELALQLTGDKQIPKFIYTDSGQDIDLYEFATNDAWANFCEKFHDLIDVCTIQLRSIFRPDPVYTEFKQTISGLTPQQLEEQQIAFLLRKPNLLMPLPKDGVIEMPHPVEQGDHAHAISYLTSQTAISSLAVTQRLPYPLEMIKSFI